MGSVNYHEEGQRNRPEKRNINVVDLLNRAKVEEKKERRQTLIIAAGAVSALAVSAIIISL